MACWASHQRGAATGKSVVSFKFVKRMRRVLSCFGSRDCSRDDVLARQVDNKSASCLATVSAAVGQEGSSLLPGAKYGCLSDKDGGAGTGLTSGTTQPNPPPPPGTALSQVQSMMQKVVELRQESASLISVQHAVDLIADEWPGVLARLHVANEDSAMLLALAPVAAPATAAGPGTGSLLADNALMALHLAQADQLMVRLNHPGMAMTAALRSADGCYSWFLGDKGRGRAAPPPDYEPFVEAGAQAIVSVVVKLPKAAVGQQGAAAVLTLAFPHSGGECRETHRNLWGMYVRLLASGLGTLFVGSLAPRYLEVVQDLYSAPSLDAAMAAVVLQLRDLAGRSGSGQLWFRVALVPPHGTGNAVLFDVQSEVPQAMSAKGAFCPPASSYHFAAAMVGNHKVFRPGLECHLEDPCDSDFSSRASGSTSSNSPHDPPPPALGAAPQGVPPHSQNNAVPLAGALGTTPGFPAPVSVVSSSDLPGGVTVVRTVVTKPQTLLQRVVDEGQQVLIPDLQRLMNQGGLIAADIFSVASVRPPASVLLLPLVCCGQDGVSQSCYGGVYCLSGVLTDFSDVDEQLREAVVHVLSPHLLSAVRREPLASEFLDCGQVQPYVDPLNAEGLKQISETLSQTSSDASKATSGDDSSAQTQRQTRCQEGAAQMKLLSPGLSTIASSSDGGSAAGAMSAGGSATRSNSVDSGSSAASAAAARWVHATSSSCYSSNVSLLGMASVIPEEPEDAAANRSTSPGVVTSSAEAASTAAHARYMGRGGSTALETQSEYFGRGLSALTTSATTCSNQSVTDADVFLSSRGLISTSLVSATSICQPIGTLDLALPRLAAPVVSVKLSGDDSDSSTLLTPLATGSSLLIDGGGGGKGDCHLLIAPVSAFDTSASSFSDDTPLTSAVRGFKVALSSSATSSLFDAVSVMAMSALQAAPTVRTASSLTVSSRSDLCSVVTGGGFAGCKAAFAISAAGGSTDGRSDLCSLVSGGGVTVAETVSSGPTGCTPTTSFGSTSSKIGHMLAALRDGAGCGSSAGTGFFSTTNSVWAGSTMAPLLSRVGGITPLLPPLLPPLPPPIISTSSASSTSSGNSSSSSSSSQTDVNAGKRWASYTGAMATGLTDKIGLNRNMTNMDVTNASHLAGLQFVGLLGRGGFGFVVQGTWCGMTVAVKFVQCLSTDLLTDKASLKHAHEVAILSSVSHPNIVQAYAFMSDVKLADIVRICLKNSSRELRDDAAFNELLEMDAMSCHIEVLELCDQGTMVDALRRNRFRLPVPPVQPDPLGLPPAGTLMVGGLAPPPSAGAAPTQLLSRLQLPGSQAPNMPVLLLSLMELASAVGHLHSLGIVHCDIKPDNILLKSSTGDARGFTLKLADFGLSRVQDGSCVTFPCNSCGTLSYVAPEALSSLKVNNSIDVYSFGILMYELYTSQRPYAVTKREDLLHAVVEVGTRPSFPPGTSPAYADLARACWDAAPEHRPRFSHIIVELGRMLSAQVEVREEGAAVPTRATVPVQQA